MNATTHMVHAAVDVRRLRRWAANRGLRYGEGGDNGYVLHVLLAGIFGPGVLQPFRLMAGERSPSGSLYGYSPKSSEELATDARSFGTPDSLQVIEPQRIESKRMPTGFAQGTRVGFDLRARPVVRLPDPRAEVHGGAHVSTIEIDIHERKTRQWMAAKRGEAPRAERVYAEWLAGRLGDAARIERCDIRRVDVSKAWRGEQRASRGRSVVLHGEIEVTDRDAFNRLLARGIGRHKAYGYGMLLLRPPRRAARAAA